MGIAPDPVRIGELIRGLLDREYTGTTEAVLRAIYNNGTVTRALDQLDQEVARLEALGLSLTQDNPVLRAVLADLDSAMQANGALVNSVVGAVQESAVNAAGPITRQLALPGFTDAMLSELGIVWNVPDVEAINALVGFVQNPAFEDKIAAYVNGTLAQVQNLLIREIVSGKGPLAIARDLRLMLTGLPAANANQLLRTLQLTSFREAQRAHRIANVHILEYQIRIATLDDRTCMSCIALHGTTLPIDARIDDHHQGRCTSVTKVRGLPAPIIETGEAWFMRQPETRQIDMMGGSAWRAWQDGAIQLSDFPKPYQDDLFGTMIGENSLVGILGEEAQQYYE